MIRSKESSPVGCLPSTDQRPKKILIVDDSDGVRRVVHCALESQMGLHVCGEAVDGLDAIHKARALKPDLIVIDLAMPRMNGAEAAKILKSIMPHVPIVLFTSYGGALSQSLSSNTICCDALISKPDGMSELVPCIRFLLQVASD